MKPLLRPHYTFRTEPPDSSGEEVIVFASEGRRVVIKGRNFREFVKRVVPLLDGTRTIAEIHSGVADQFALADLEAALRTLEAQRIVEDAERHQFDPAAVRQALPQISYLRESHTDPVQAMEALARATVAVVGVGAVGASAALSLVASRVGTLRCIDARTVEPADSFLTQHYFQSEVGRMRVEALRDRAVAINPSCRVETYSEEIEEDGDLAKFVSNADFALGAADAGMVSLDYKLNRVCAARGIPWSSARATGFEGVLGPTVLPGRTACFVCATMRSVACHHHPEDALRHQRFLDRRKRDDSNAREGLAFDSGIMGRLLAHEAFHYLVTGEVALPGRLLVLDFEEMTSTQHRVLRVPNCPVCGTAPEEET
jgi:bacteriocin biosynthesis cyclodehydratase domain-containing protein